MSVHNQAHHRTTNGALLLLAGWLAILMPLTAMAQDSRCERRAEQLQRYEERVQRSGRAGSSETLERLKEKLAKECPNGRAEATTAQGDAPSRTTRPERPQAPPAVTTPKPRASGTPPTRDLCAIDASRPECRSSMELSTSFGWFSATEHSRCANEKAPPGRPRDHCMQSVIEKASAAGLVSSSAIEDCRSEAAARPSSQDETVAVYLCLERRSASEDARTSSVLRAAATAPKPSLRKDGYRRGTTVAAMHAADWARLPQQTDSAIYFLNALGYLESACPALNLQAVQLQIIQAAQRNVSESAARIAQRRGTVEDLSRVLAIVGPVFQGMEDCDQHVGDDFRYESCVRSKHEALALPESADARHDASLLVRRHGCASAEPKDFANNIGQWLTMRPEKQEAINWAVQGGGRAAELDGLFQNCRRQAGRGAADAWCGCYVQRYSETKPGSRAYPTEVYESAKSSAFFGDHRSWFVPSGLDSCESQRAELELWRRSTSRVTTACLLSQAPLRALRPELRACRYRTAWGEIEVRATQCLPALQSNVWGGEPVTCN